MMVDFPRFIERFQGTLEPKLTAVMPVNAGIQVHSRLEFNNRLGSGLRRKDGKQSKFWCRKILS